MNNTYFANILAYIPYYLYVNLFGCSHYISNILVIFIFELSDVLYIKSLSAISIPDFFIGEVYSKVIDSEYQNLSLCKSCVSFLLSFYTKILIPVSL